MRNKKDGFLSVAYDLDSPDKTQALYTEWASTYDQEVTDNGYATPGRMAAAMVTLVEDVTAPLLDLGCGTGLSGQAFARVGFTCVDGTDLSAEMVDGAKTKNVYRNLAVTRADDPIPNGYGNIAAVGVFSPGHAPPTLISAAVDALPVGGCLGFSLNDHVLEDPRFEAAIRELSNAGKVEIAFREYGAHLPKIHVRSFIYVLRRL